MSTSDNFPEGWFFIKNLSNGYVLMVENPTPDAGSPVVISSIRTKDADSQLWNYNEQGHLTNKKTGLVMDVAKGNAKAGSDIVQQTVSTTGKPENNYQTFGTTVDGHVYLKQKPTLVLGIKESFFSRREGLHVHLQLMDKRHLERKEQRWEFIVPIIKTASSATLTSVSTSTSLKRAPSVGPAETATKPLGRDLTNIKEDESQRIPIGTFPETAFFLKSQTNGYYIGTEAGSIAKSGTRLTIDSLRKSAYDSQLWTFDPTTHRIVNKHSGLVLSIEGNSLAEDAYACQSAPFENSGKTQAWTLSPEGEICLRNDNAWVLGYKDSWFSNREGAHLHLQRSSKNNQLQRFSVVLPVFKKHKAETITTVEHSGVFPEGWFFVKSQAQGLVLTVLESGTLAAQAVAVKLDTANYSRQLWKYNNGTLVNKASEMVLDVKGGSLVSGAEICQYKEKPESTNQQWGLTADGCIHIKSFGNLVLSVNANEKSKSNVFLATKSTDQKEQRWNFVLPVFKKKTTVREVASTPTVKKTITYRYAQYPTGWFFIRSFQTGSTKENPLVLTSDKSTQTIRLARLSRESWRYQLWSYSNGSLINYETDMAIDVSSIVAGAGLIQNKKQEIASQRWSLSIEGYLIQDSEPTMALIPQEEGSDKYKLSLGAHGSKQEYRWGLLIPQFGYKAGSQVLLEWTIHYLKEWRRSGSQTIQKTVHSVAAWPEDVFYIRAHDGLAVVPKTAEAYSEITLRKLEVSNASEFQWAFRNGRITHVSSGLILEAVDELAHGKLLQLSVEEANNARQQWVIKTDGSIVSQSQNELGFSLVQKSNVWLLQLSDSTKASSTHYAWSVLYGRYESSVLIGFRRIILTILTTRTTTNRQLVTHRYAIFPKGWFFVRSKADESLVLTIENTKQGTKIILAKLDFKIFRRQLWQYRDDGCLSNMDTDFVIDVAGGALLANSSVIQWQEKSLKKQRKNQLWGLSVEGHIHPQSRSGLVLGPKGDKISEGAEIQLRARGGLDLKYQQWNFATPQFGKRSPGSEISRTDSTLTIEGVSVPKEVATADAERYERITKRTIIRRWGRFPDGSFFVRAFNGKDHLALTVVESSKTQVAGGAEYTVSLQAINFKAYKWQFWTYQDGHLINVQTGLALDSRSVKDAMVESGLRSQLRVREVSSAETQFWGLSANGEIHQKSNERLVAGVSSAERTTVEGAQIGLRQLRTVKTNANNVEESKLQSEEWLRWMFSKPLFTTRTITRTVGNETTETTEEVLDKVEEIPVTVQEVNESEGEESDSEEENDEDSEDEVEEELSPESPAPNSAAVDTVTTTVNKDGEGKTTTTTTTTTTRGVVSEKAPEKEVITKPIPAVAEKQEASLKKSNSSKSLRLGRKDSFQLSEDYIPTGFEKVVRYKTHQGNFPTGYFLIKSHLHGYVLDIQGDAVDEAYVILTRIKVTDFSSQLWCYRDGLIYNLKNPSLVLDAAKQTIISGERAHLSIQHADDGRPEDRIWDHNSEEGLINLRAKRSLVLSVKELRRSENYTHIDVYVMEEKVHTHQKGKGAGARREQRWEILIPSLIPVAQADGGVKIVEAGKVSSVSSSASALLAFRGLKETFIHKITSTNQWPSTDKWFFIRYGAEDYFLAADEEKQVGVYKLQDNDDYKRFLWIYVDGYLVNYKYLLRLVLNENKRWILSNSYDQTFQISARGVITVRIQKIIYYLRIVRRSNRYELIASTEESGDGYVMQLHIPIFSDNEIEKDCHNASTTVVTSVRQPSRTTTVTTIIRRAFFPDSAWFFIKVDRKEQEDLVLAVEKESETADSKLVVKKLNLRSFQSQLWTYRDGLLINYGSKLVIDVKGDLVPSASLIQSSEAGVSSQKWALNVDGEIYLESHKDLVLGHKGTTVKDDTEVVLSNKETDTESTTTRSIIRWKFTTPIFGKKTTTTSTSAPAPIGSITEAIEQGAVITKTEHAPVKVVDTIKEVCPKGDIVTKTRETGEVINVRRGSKDVIFHHTDAKKLHKKQDRTDNVLVRTTYKPTQTVVTETRSIIRAWRVVFIQRLRRCKNQQEFVKVIEDQRRILNKRLDDYSKTIAAPGAQPTQPQETVEEIKKLYNTRVFKYYLDIVKGYKPNQKISLKELDFDKTIKETTEEVDRHLDDVVTRHIESTTTKRTTTKAPENTKPIITEVEDEEEEDVKVKETQLVSTQKTLATTQTIKTIVRYWYIILYRRVNHAIENGASEDEVKKIVDEANEDLDKKLKAVETTTKKSSHVVPNTNTQLIEDSVVSAIKRTKEIVKKQTDTIHKNKQPKTEEELDEIVEDTDKDLTTELKTYQTIITQEISGVEEDSEDEIDETPTTAVEAKETEVAKKVVNEKLNDTKEQITEWFTQIDKDITTCLDETTPESKDDAVTVIDAAQLDIVTKIDDTITSVNTYYDSMPHLSWVQRRQILYNLESTKANLLTRIIRFKTILKDETTPAKDIRRYITYSFGPAAQKTVVTEIEEVTEQIKKPKKETIRKSSDDKPSEIVEEVTKTYRSVKETKPHSKKPTVEEVKEVFNKTEKSTVIVEGIKITGKKPKIVTKETKEGTIVVIEDVEFIGEKPTIVEDVTTAIKDTESTAIVLEGIETIGERPTFVMKETDEGKVIVATKETTTSVTVIEGVKPETHNQQISKEITTLIEEVTEDSIVVEGIEVVKGEKPTGTRETKEVIVVEGVKPTAEQPEVVDNVRETVTKTTTTTVIEGVEVTEEKPTVVVRESTEGTVVVVEGVKPTTEKPTVKDIKKVFETIEKTSVITIVVRGVKPTSDKPETVEDVVKTIEETTTSVTVIEGVKPVDDEKKPTVPTVKDIETVIEEVTKETIVVEGVKVVEELKPLSDKPTIVEEVVREVVIVKDVEVSEDKPKIVEDVIKTIKETDTELIVIEGVKPTEDKPTVTEVTEVTETTEKTTLIVEGVEKTEEVPTVKDITTVIEEVTEESIVVEVVDNVRETVTKTTTTTVIEGVEVTEEKPTVVVRETTEGTVVAVEVTKETVVVEGVKVVEKKPETKTREVPTKEVVIPEGTEHGLNIVEETNKTVSGWLSGLVTRFTSPTDEDNKPTTTTERSIEHVTVTSEKELDRICDEAKEKVITQVSKVTGQKPTKEEQDKLVRAIDSMKETAKVTLTEVKETTIAHKDKPEDVTEKLQTITDKTHEHINTHYETVKDTITD
ncbi:hypothetical protein J3Q64DRAFT_1641628, partial [Phycomyces blakesleeanus]